MAQLGSHRVNFIAVFSLILFANDQAKVLQFAAFRDHGLGHAALYPR